MPISGEVSPTEELRIAAAQDRNSSPALAVSLMLESQSLTDDDRRTDAVSVPHGRIELTTFEDAVFDEGDLTIQSLGKNLVRLNVSPTSFDYQGEEWQLPDIGLNLGHSIRGVIGDGITFDRQGFSLSQGDLVHGRGPWRSEVFTDVIFAAALKNNVARIGEPLPGRQNERIYGRNGARRPYVLGAIALDRLGPQAYDLAGKARPDGLDQ